jgi:DNA-directed RNA polymerase subunit beta'
MGHISLVVPVAHIWYFRSLPNKIGYLLGLPTKKLDSIIYYERYVVINPGVKAVDGVKYLDFLTEEEYLEITESLPKENQYLEDSHPDKFVADMGAEALYKLLSRIHFVIEPIQKLLNSVKMRHLNAFRLLKLSEIPNWLTNLNG